MKNVGTGVNAPAKLSKRLVSALIELFLVIATTYLLFTFVATPIANKAVDYTGVRELNASKTAEYYTIAKEEQYGIIEGFKQKGYNFTLEYTSEYENATTAEKEEMLKPFNEDERIIKLTTEITELTNKINTTSNIMLIAAALLPEVVFWLIIPLKHKKKKSIGMMINKLEIIHRDDLEVSNKQIVNRFLSLYLLQTVVCFFVFGVKVVYMVPLICFIGMFMSVNRYAIHDLIAKTKIVDEDPILFRDLEDRDNYLNFNRHKRKRVLEAEINEVSDEQ